MQGETHLDGRILIVDDEQANVTVLERMLGRAGYKSLSSTTDSRRALALFEQTRPDLVLLDLMMPHLDGYAVMQQILGAVPEGSYLPILVLTADVTPGALRRALSEGAKDFLTKPFDQTELLLRVRNLLETRMLYRAMEQQLNVLERLSTQAHAAVRFRDESLSEISHDLGQPLAALRFITEGLVEDVKGEDPLDRKQLAQSLARLESAAGQISSMIVELSDIARLQMGQRLVLQRKEVAIAGLARRVVDDYARMGSRHRLRVEAGGAATDVIGSWDEARLRRAISNLVSNAIKYSPQGGDVTVELSLTPAGDCVRVAVSDQGIGIAEADLDHVFERFYRAANAPSHSHGTGIGLAGVRAIVEQHGGSVSIESEQDKGTTVTLELPLRPPA